MRYWPDLTHELLHFSTRPSIGVIEGSLEGDLALDHDQVADTDCLGGPLADSHLTHNALQGRDLPCAGVHLLELLDQGLGQTLIVKLK